MAINTDLLGLLVRSIFSNQLPLYDYNSANKVGYKQYTTGHMPSRVDSGENRGLFLKHWMHPTIDKAIKADKQLGYNFYTENGKLYSFLPDDEILKDKNRRFTEIDFNKIK